MVRRANVERKTKETDVKVELGLDGLGKSRVKTSVAFLDHMLVLLSRHGLIDLTVAARGDTEIDDHHTVEDVGIVIGKAIRQALGTMEGISRYGQATVPMDEALASVTLDVSGRAYLVYRVEFPKKSRLKGFDPDLVEDFFQALVGNAGITLHIVVPYGRNTHHMIEAVFKAFGRALRQAAAIDPRVKGIPSTKGSLSG